MTQTSFCNPRGYKAYLLQKVLSRECLKDVLLTALLDFSAEHEFVEHEVSLLKIEDYVQFADLRIREGFRGNNALI